MFIALQAKLECIPQMPPTVPNLAHCSADHLLFSHPREK